LQVSDLERDCRVQTLMNLQRFAQQALSLIVLTFREPELCERSERLRNGGILRAIQQALRPKRALEKRPRLAETISMIENLGESTLHYHTIWVRFRHTRVCFCGLPGVDFRLLQLVLPRHYGSKFR